MYKCIKIIDIFDVNNGFLLYMLLFKAKENQLFINTNQRIKCRIWLLCGYLYI